MLSEPSARKMVHVRDVTNTNTVRVASCLNRAPTKKNHVRDVTNTNTVRVACCLNRAPARWFMYVM